MLHVDMDAFFAAVEVLERPELAGTPVVVGGTGRRGVVASCTYEARAYGVRSAMPTGSAMRLCPTATLLAGRYDVYRGVSSALHEVLRSFTPKVEGVGLDEAYLDVSGAHGLFGSGPEIAARVRRAVHDGLELWCSIGVARSKLVAKLASEAAKPNVGVGEVSPGEGVVVVAPQDEIGFLRPMPLTALPGVGPATSRKLARMGLATVADLASVPSDALAGALGRVAGRRLGALARGEDARRVEPSQKPRSVSHEQTYPYDIVSPDHLRAQVARLSEAVAARLQNGGLTAKTVTLKVRLGDFSTLTRSRTFASPVDDSRALAGAALDLLERVDSSAGVRLLGVNASGLERGSCLPQALPLGRAGGHREMSLAVAAVRARFGEGSVVPATVAGGAGRADHGDRWGPNAQRRA